MIIPCFVSFEVFILKVTVFWDVMWSDRYVPVFQRKPCSLSFILKNVSIYILRFMVSDSRRWLFSYLVLCTVLMFFIVKMCKCPI